MVGSDPSGHLLLTREIRRQVAILAVMGLVAYAGYLIVDSSLYMDDLSRSYPESAVGETIGERQLVKNVSIVSNSFGVLLAALLVAMAFRRKAWVPGLVLFAHVLQVLLCANLTGQIIWRAALAGDVRLPLFSWVLLIILLVPLIVPTTPLRTLVSSLVCAATIPLGMLVLESLPALREIEPLDRLRNEMILRSNPGVPTSEGAGFGLRYYVVRTLPAVVAAAAATFGALRMSGPRRRLGNFELVERIGEGGRGEVWRARHRFVSKEAAIKLIRPKLLETVPRERRRAVMDDLFREADLVSQLTSSQSVDLYDFGMSDDGRLYIVMELLNGLTLEKLVDRHGPVPPSRVKGLLTALHEPPDEAHRKEWIDERGRTRRGIVHRDIKPSNVFIVKAGTSYDVIKVVDWGIAFRGGSLDAKGTPGFMAPEQIRGDELDARTDIYAIGCLLYWLLTGGDYVFSGNREEMSASHLGPDVAEPPSRRLAERATRGGEIPWDVPGCMDALVMKCLEKNPAERPQNVGDLLRLASACDVGDWTPQDADRWWRDHEPELVRHGDRT